MKTTPTVQRLSERTVRMYDAYRGMGVHAELIRNPLGEPLGVVARGAFDPSRVALNATLEQILGPTYDPRIETVKSAIPISGPRVYPPDFLDLVDLTAQAAANRAGLAHDFKCKVRGDDDFTERGRGLGLHADFVGSDKHTPKGTPLHGLNVWANRWGIASAQFGVLRDLDDDNELERIKMETHKATQQARADQLDESQIDTIIQNGRQAEHDAYMRLAAPFSEPVILRPGDFLAFQAQQHAEQGVPPVAHNFDTISETRRSDVLKPMLGETAMVQAARFEVIDMLQLRAMGY